MSTRKKEDEIFAGMIGGGILGGILAGAPGAIIGAILGILITSTDNEDKKNTPTPR
ncbi:hypothetical protein [Palaeococcus ferrophilus]|uniref:hypothetical protein n=1 Tax=Palaeococcus ferrophilus TaxID=83868 RepID=UPI0012F86DEA|nr:hypothetical protein [Palaeococcus ferrophilus]